MKACSGDGESCDRAVCIKHAGSWQSGNGQEGEEQKRAASNSARGTGGRQPPGGRGTTQRECRRRLHSSPNRRLEGCAGAMRHEGKCRGKSVRSCNGISCLNGHTAASLGGNHRAGVCKGVARAGEALLSRGKDVAGGRRTKASSVTIQAVPEAVRASGGRTHGLTASTQQAHSHANPVCQRAPTAPATLLLGAAHAPLRLWEKEAWLPWLAAPAAVPDCSPLFPLKPVVGRVRRGAPKSLRRSLRFQQRGGRQRRVSVCKDGAGGRRSVSSRHLSGGVGRLLTVSGRRDAGTLADLCSVAVKLYSQLTELLGVRRHLARSTRGGDLLQRDFVSCRPLLGLLAGHRGGG